MRLLDRLARVPDRRRPQGRRSPLPEFPAAAIMAMLSGHHGDRPISRFLRDDADDLRRRLGWPRAAFPSNVAVRAALRAPDFRALSAEFRAWAAERLPDGELLALDAKAIRSTVVDHDRRRPRPSDAGLRRAGQRLRDAVRAGRGPGWSQSGLVVGATADRRQETREVHAAQDADLAGAPDLSGKPLLEGRTVTRDALRCTKRRLERSPTPAASGS